LVQKWKNIPKWQYKYQITIKYTKMAIKRKKYTTMAIKIPNNNKIYQNGNKNTK
jgi:hypothetical protein